MRVRYRRFKHSTICLTGKWLWELAAGQIAAGALLLAYAYIAGTGEPPAILWMSALALMFSGVCTMAVIAVAADK